MVMNDLSGEVAGWGKQGLNWTGQGRPKGWADRAGSENGGVQGEAGGIVARQGVAMQLMRSGVWADGSTGFLSLRLQLQVNAELVLGDSCQNLRLANLYIVHYANITKQSLREIFFFFLLIITYLLLSVKNLILLFEL